MNVLRGVWQTQVYAGDVNLTAHQTTLAFVPNYHLLYQKRKENASTNVYTACTITEVVI